MTITSQDIANQALELIGNNAPPISSQAPNWDATPAGQALQKLYAPCVATVMRQFGYDFARTVAALVLTGGVAPFDFSYEYVYPTSQGARAPQLLQVMPQTQADPNNPLPIDWVVGNNVSGVGGAQIVVIWTNVPNALAVYTNLPVEATWDALFREAVVRLLASELAMALSGRPDTMQALQESGAAFQGVSEGRDS